MTCSFATCNSRAAILDTGFCKYCDRKYCLAHRLPESHSQLCTDALKHSSKLNYTNESKRIINLNSKRGDERIEKLIHKSGGDLVKAAQMDKEEVSKRLKEKIAAARPKKSK